MSAAAEYVDRVFRAQVDHMRDLARLAEEDGRAEFAFFMRCEADELEEAIEGAGEQG